MRNLIRADIDRIFRRKILWVILAAAFIIMVVTVVLDVADAPDKGITFTVSILDGVGIVGLLAGIILVLNIYAGDFKSMTFISVIGRGISRQKLIIAKFLDTFLILTGIYIVSGVITLVMKVILGVTLSPDMVKYIILEFVSAVICTTTSVVIAAAFFYLTENAILGIIAYLSAELFIPAGLFFVNMIPFIAKYHPERFYFNGMSSSMVTDFMIGATGEGVLKLLVIIVVYICGANLATILLFRKKELEFGG